MPKVCPWGGKASYTSENQAKAARNSINRKGKEMRIYRCPNCYNYHFTSRNV